MFERINPAKKDCIAAIIVNPHTIKVGNLETRPVAKYSNNTGIKKTVDIKANKAPNIPKKASGL